MTRITVNEDNWESLKVQVLEDHLLTDVPKTRGNFQALLQRLQQGDPILVSLTVTEENRGSTATIMESFYSPDRFQMVLDEVADMFTPTSYSMSWAETSEDSDTIQQAAEAAVFSFDTIVGTGICGREIVEEGEEQDPGPPPTTRTYVTGTWESVFSPNWNKFVAGFASCHHDYGSYGDRLCIHHSGFDILCFFRDGVQRNLEWLQDFLMNGEKESAA